MRNGSIKISLVAFIVGILCVSAMVWANRASLKDEHQQCLYEQGQLYDAYPLNARLGQCK